MKFPTATDKGRVFITCTIETQYTWENIPSQHILAYIFSGELQLSYGKNSLTFVAGDTVLVPQNQLSRSVKLPSSEEPFKCVSMLLPEEQLRKFYLNRPILESWAENISTQRPVKPHPFTAKFFGSLLPYFEIEDELPEELVSVKIQEALTIIDTVDKRVSSVLGTFQQIGKINLEKYMEEHFMYNLPLEKFAFLTGRSLTTFKQDFKNIFKTTPGKWLTEKRLDLAHHKLTKEKQKPTDVYLSAGFENLSHFRLLLRNNSVTAQVINLNQI